MDQAVFNEPSKYYKPVLPHNRYSVNRIINSTIYHHIFVAGLWIVPLTMFVVGWVFQFIGHAFEGKPPEFF